MAPSSWPTVVVKDILIPSCGDSCTSAVNFVGKPLRLGMLDFSRPDSPPDFAHDLAVDLVFYVITCCTGAFLCMLVGCRINVLRCSKEIKNPPLLFLALLLFAVFTYGGNLLLQHLVNSGIVKACHTGALYPLLMTVLQKFFVFCYFIEAMHALRACKSCGQENCKLLGRWRHDFVWLIYLVLLVIGTVAEIIHVSVGRQAAQFLPLNSCRIIESTTVALHLLLWRGAYSILLTMGFFCLGMCTVAHWPVLNDVSRWQYGLRIRLFKILPSCVKHATNEQFGADQPLKCPAYLVPINGRTAGISERSAFMTVMTVLLTMLPTAANLGLLIAFQGVEKSWLFFLTSNLDVWANVVLIHAFSNNPTENDENKRNERLQATQQDCSRPHLGSSRCSHRPIPAVPRTPISEVTSDKAMLGRYDESLDTINTTPTRSYFTDKHPLMTSTPARTFMGIRSESRASTMKETSSPENCTPGNSTLIEEARGNGISTYRRRADTDVGA